MTKTDSGNERLTQGGKFMVVQHNLSAMNANRMLGITQGTLSKSTEKLSSGYKVNRAADDAAGLSISEKMRKQIRGLEQASLNAEDGISAVQTAEGALTEVHDMLQRMNELAVKASNGTNSLSDRQTIQDEVDQLLTEIDRVAETTKFNETYLLKGDTDTVTKKLDFKDAGIEGKLVQGAETGTFTMTALAAGDTIKIGGTEYTISGADTDAKTAYAGAVAGEQVEIDGTQYTVVAAGGTENADKNQLTVSSLDDLVQAGSVVKYGGKTYYTAPNEDENVIEASTAYEKIAEQLVLASSIGSDGDAKAEIKNNDDGTFTLTKKAEVDIKQSLNFGLHVGADADMTNKITVNIDAMDTASLGIKGLNVKDSSGAAATYAIDAIADAVAKVSAQRSELGAVQNRLEHTIKNLDNVVENTTAAESQIRDTDMATEMVKYSNANILSQAGQSMLAQANQSNQGVLSILG